MALTTDTAAALGNPEDGEGYLAAADGSSFAGGFVGLDASGFLNKIPGPGVNNSAFRFRGASYNRWSNVGGANGAFSARVERGILYSRDVLAGDPVTQADVGNTIYLEDDNTVRRTSNTNTRCAGGMLEKINDDGTVDIKCPTP